MRQGLARAPRQGLPLPVAKARLYALKRRGCAGQIRNLLRERGKHPLRSLGVPFRSAQDVEGHDIARAFPDRVERHFAIESRERTFLDIAVTAEALHRLVDIAGRRLANPELR